MDFVSARTLPQIGDYRSVVQPLYLFSGIIAWVRGTKTNAFKWFLVSGLLSGMAVLTKGPVGPLLIGLTVLIMRLWSRTQITLV